MNESDMFNYPPRNIGTPIEKKTKRDRQREAIKVFTEAIDKHLAAIEYHRHSIEMLALALRNGVTDDEQKGQA